MARCHICRIGKLDAPKCTGGLPLTGEWAPVIHFSVAIASDRGPLPHGPCSAENEQ